LILPGEETAKTARGNVPSEKQAVVETTKGHRSIRKFHCWEDHLLEPELYMTGNLLLPVSLQCLSPDRVTPCDLFHRTGENTYVYFARKNYLFSADNQEQLRANGVEHLYVTEEDAALYLAYLKDLLVSTLRDPCCSAEKKAATLYATSQDIMRRVFDDPRTFFIDHAHDIIVQFVDLIVSDANVTRCLIRLASHEPSTYIHSTNVGIFSTALAGAMLGHTPGKGFRNCGASFFLHDIGKCCIPLEILNKTGPLTDEEFSTIKTHPVHGYQLLKDSGGFSEEDMTITLQHHERDNGSGYPYGLKGDDIHPYAKICRLADVYEALTADRPYRKSYSTFEALNIMKKEVGDMDRVMFEQFVKLFGF
jgi:HD-GYP domain-containing protein (c-di-GMP phosphodiesterase class II)